MEVVPFSIYAPTKPFADAIIQTLIEKGYTTDINECYEHDATSFPWIKVNNDGAFDGSKRSIGQELNIKNLVELPMFEPKPKLIIGAHNIEIEGDYLIYDKNYKAPKTEVLEFLRNLFDNRLGAYTMSVDEESQMGVGCLKGRVKEFKAIYNYLAEKSGEEVSF